MCSHQLSSRKFRDGFLCIAIKNHVPCLKIHSQNVAYFYCDLYGTLMNQSGHFPDIKGKSPHLKDNIIISKKTDTLSQIFLEESGWMSQGYPFHGLGE